MENTMLDVVDTPCNIENVTADTLDIPRSYLKGYNAEDFFVFAVKSNTMYPLYQKGDKVLILKCDSIDYSGQICLISCHNEDNSFITLAKLVCKDIENSIITPANPTYKPVKVKNEDICVIGTPKFLIREIETR